jgi:hypothetical protein
METFEESEKSKKHCAFCAGQGPDPQDPELFCPKCGEPSEEYKHMIYADMDEEINV